MKPEITLESSIKMGWAKHKRNNDKPNYFRYVRRKIKAELHKLKNGS